MWKFIRTFDADPIRSNDLILDLWNGSKYIDTFAIFILRTTNADAGDYPPEWSASSTLLR